MTLDKGVKKKKTRGNLGTRKGGGFFNTKKQNIQDLTSGHRTTNWISGGGVRNCRTKCRYRTTSLYVYWDYNIVVRETYVHKDIEYYHFIYVILQGFWGWNPKYKRGNVKGVSWVCDLGWTKQLG